MMSLGALPGCRICKGCGENVITTEALPDAAAVRTRSTRIWRWPRCSPSKFPIVTELRCEGGKCLKSWRIFIGERAARALTLGGLKSFDVGHLQVVEALLKQLSF